MTSGRRRLDEDDVRVRPGRGKTRPRSKDRPRHESAVDGLVTAVDRGRFTVLVGSGPEAESVMAVKAREIGRKGIVVGDEVRVMTGGESADLARLVSVQPRRTVLRRSAEDGDATERVIVANADQLAIVTAIANPTPRPGLIDRALVAAYDGGLQPVIVITKCDLADPRPLIDLYADLGVTAYALSPDTELAGLICALEGRMTVLLGHSGVGKSTLVNRLVPEAGRDTGRVNEVTGRGRHTSSSAVALPLAQGGWLIDTPGIRSLGLGHVERERVISSFADLVDGTADCPRGCSHDEAECALDGWAGAQGPAAVARVESMRRLLRSMAAEGTSSSLA